MAGEARSVAREGLDAARVHDEAHHDDDAEHKEDRLKAVCAVLAEMEEVGERPAGGEGRAEHLGADQDRRAADGEHVEPVDAARRRLLNGGVHRFFSAFLSIFAALRARLRRQCGRNEWPDQGRSSVATPRPRPHSAALHRPPLDLQEPLEASNLVRLLHPLLGAAGTHERVHRVGGEVLVGAAHRLHHRREGRA